MDMTSKKSVVLLYALPVAVVFSLLLISGVGRSGLKTRAPGTASESRLSGYLHHTTVPPSEVDRTLQRTVVVGGGVEVTVNPGERARDLVARLVEKGYTTRAAYADALLDVQRPSYNFALPPKSNPVWEEGLFRPGTYRFDGEEVHVLVKGGTYDRAYLNAVVIIDRLLTEGASRLQQLTPSDDLGPYEQIILASIVQKEAVSGVGYGGVSEVFHRRLRMGVPLGSCPSVEYALGYHRPFLTLGDVKIDSPYNVYLHTGLPPTPICFFSDEALAATRHPDEGNYMFFVYDWTRGKLLFARTYREHLSNAKTARLNYVKKYGLRAIRTVYPDKFYQQ
jgi:UPF0755 protein